MKSFEYLVTRPSI